MKRKQQGVKEGRNEGKEGGRKDKESQPTQNSPFRHYDPIILH